MQSGQSPKSFHSTGYSFITSHTIWTAQTRLILNLLSGCIFTTSGLTATTTKLQISDLHLLMDSQLGGCLYFPSEANRRSKQVLSGQKFLIWNFVRRKILFRVVWGGLAGHKSLWYYFKFNGGLAHKTQVPHLPTATLKAELHVWISHWNGSLKQNFCITQCQFQYNTFLWNSSLAASQ